MAQSQYGYFPEYLPFGVDITGSCAQYIKITDPPTEDTHATNKAYVDKAASPNTWYSPVVVASTGNIADLANDMQAGDSIDGIVLSTDDRILLKDQTDPIENGIYVADSGGARADDLPVGAEAATVAMFVQRGTLNADTAWVCTNNKGADIVGTDGLVFVPFGTTVSNAAGTVGQVQYTDGSGGFVTTANNQLHFTDTAAAGVLLLGEEGGTFTLDGVDAVSAGVAGTSLNLHAGDGLTTGLGGSIDILGGAAPVTGGSVSITGGVGSSDVGGSVTITSGSSSSKGGAIQIETSAGGAGVGTGGALSLITGDGGTTSGNAGNISIVAGSVSGGGSGTGGDISLTTGASSSVNTDGHLKLLTGFVEVGNKANTNNLTTFTMKGEDISGGSTAGTDVLIVGGDGGVASGQGGLLSLTGGAGGGTGDGGDLWLLAGAAGTTSGSGGDTVITGGERGSATVGVSGSVMISTTDGGTSSGDSGAITIDTGDTGLAGNVGGISIIAGSTTGAGAGGDVVITAGTSGGGADGQLLLQQNGQQFLWPTDTPSSGEVMSVLATGTPNTLEWIPAADPADVALNTTHRTSDGSDHSFINQDVTTTGTPSFTTVTATGTVTGGSVTDGVASLSGGTLSNLAAPVAGGDATNKSYVDTVVSLNLLYTDPVDVATDAPGTLASSFENGDTVDGYVLVTGDRILIKDQASGVENGIYVVNASGAPTRASDMAATSSAAGVSMFVTNGSANVDTIQVCSNTAGSDVVGTDALVFVQVSAATDIVAGDGLTLTGTTMSVNVDDVGIEINTDTLRLKDAGTTNAKLANSSLTVTAGTGLQNGGVVSLGGSTTLDIDSTVITTGGGQSIAGTTTIDTLSVTNNASADTITVSGTGDSRVNTTRFTTTDVQVNREGTGDRLAALELHSDNTGVPTFSISRAAGANGATTMTQTGTADLILNTDSGTTIHLNSSANDVDFRVGSLNDTDLIRTISTGGTAADDFVGVGFSAPAHKLDVDGDIRANSEVICDTIAERTTAAGVTIDSVLLKDGLVDGRDVAADAAHITSDGSDHTFINQDVTTTGTPTFASVAVNGNITVTGTVDGRDIAADGTATDSNTTHRTSTGTDHTYIDQDVTTTGTPTFSTVTATGALRSNTSLILEEPDAGTNTVTIAASATTGTYTLTLPVDDGTAGQVLETDGAGVLSWETPSGGGGGFTETSGSVANKSTLTFNHAQGNTTPAILTQMVNNSVVEYAPTTSIKYRMEELPTNIKATALGSKPADRETRLACCGLSNGNVVVVYSTGTNTYFTIYQQSDWTAAVSETEVGTSLDTENLVVRPMGAEFVLAYEIGGIVGIRVFSNAGVEQHSGSPTNDNTTCDHLDLAVYPDNSGFILLYEGTGQDVWYEVFDTSITGQSSAKLDEDNCEGTAVTILPGDTVVFGYAQNSTWTMETYDCSTKTALVSLIGQTEYDGGQPENTSEFMLAIDADRFLVQRFLNVGDVVIETYDVSGSTFVLTSFYRMDSVLVVNWVSSKCYSFNDLGHAMIFTEVENPANNASLSMFDKDGQVFTLGNTYIGSGQFLPYLNFGGFGCVCGISGGGFFIAVRDGSNSDHPYFMVIRARHVSLNVDDANNVTLTNYMGETLTFKMSYQG